MLLKGHITQLLPLLLIFYPVLRFFGFHATRSLPSFRTFFVQFLVFNVIEDAGFYWIHRLESVSNLLSLLKLPVSINIDFFILHTFIKQFTKVKFFTI